MKKHIHKKVSKLMLWGMIGILVSYSLLDLGYLLWGSNTYAQGELIEQAFLPSRETEGIIYMGNSKDAVGNNVFREGVNVGISKEGISADTRAPLIVRITKFLLRMTIVLSITMVLYSGVMYIIEASKGAEVKETTNSLMYIIGGVLLALMSLGILNLISSIGLSTLGGTVGG